MPFQVPEVIVPTEVKLEEITVPASPVPVKVAAAADTVPVEPRLIEVPLIVRDEFANCALSTPLAFIVATPAVTSKSAASNIAIPFNVVVASLTDAVTVPSILP